MRPNHLTRPRRATIIVGFFPENILINPTFPISTSDMRFADLPVMNNQRVLPLCALCSDFVTQKNRINKSTFHISASDGPSSGLFVVNGQKLSALQPRNKCFINTLTCGTRFLRVGQSDTRLPLWALQRALRPDLGSGSRSVEESE